MVLKFITVSTGIPERFHAAGVMAPMQSQCDAEWHIVVHTAAQRLRLLAGNVPGVAPGRVHVSGAIPAHPFAGAALQREWAEQNLIATGEWYVTVDDNVQHVEGLPKEKWPGEGGLTVEQANSLRRQFVTRLLPVDIFDRTRAIIARADRLGSDIGAFATAGGNPRFLTRHHREVAPCNTRWSVQRKAGRTWVPWPDIMLEDLVRTVSVVASGQAAPVDNWTSAYKLDGEPGGLGPSESRRGHQRADCLRMMQMYPGLLRWPKGKDWFLSFRKTNMGHVRRWLAETAAAGGGL